MTRLNRNSKIYKAIIKAIQDKKGENIVSLDLRKIDEAVADFFIICEATSGPQLRAIAEVFAENGGEAKFVETFVSAWTKVMDADRFDIRCARYHA